MSKIEYYTKVWFSKRVQQMQKKWLWGIYSIQTDGDSVFYKNMECGLDDLNESLFELFEDELKENGESIKGLSFDEYRNAFAGWCYKHRGWVKNDIEMFYEASKEE